jgi:hypothetical protein
METRLMKLKNELVEREQSVFDKMQKDIANYGVPLGNKQLRDKVLVTQNAIENLEDKLNKERKTIKERQQKPLKLTKNEQRILSAIRSNDVINNTRSFDSNRFDNRFNGSWNSRRTAWKIHNTKGE